MQDVRFFSNPNSESGKSVNYPTQQYWAPMAMKQHADRLKQFTWNKAERWENSSKTSSTYFSNAHLNDDKSDIEARFGFESEDVGVDQLIQQQKQLLDLQNSVQRSLQMIQSQIQRSGYKGNKKRAINIKQRKLSENWISSYKPQKSIMNNPVAPKTPKKSIKAPTMMRNKSAKDFWNVQNYNTWSKSFVRKPADFVDYEEVIIKDNESDFTRVVITPGKSDYKAGQRRNSRRTRGMRKALMDSQTKSNPYTPSKDISDSGNKAVNKSVSYLKFQGEGNKRSHTPGLYSRNTKPKVATRIEARQNSTTAKKSVCKPPSHITTESLRLKLYKWSRGVNLRHLNNLCQRPNQKIRELMRMFCVLLNALKKPEYQTDSSDYEDWHFIWNHINKNNWTILAEVIAVANKIERGLYEIQDLDELKDEFETLKLDPKADLSFKAIYTFVNDAIEFFKSKTQSASNAGMKPTVSKNENLNKTTVSKISKHKYSKSKGHNFVMPTKKEEMLKNYQTNPSLTKRRRKAELIDNSDCTIIAPKNLEANKSKSRAANFAPTQNKTVGIKRINPRGAQINEDGVKNEEKSPQKLNETEKINVIPRLKIEQINRMNTENECATVSSKYDTFKGTETDRVLFDSYRKYESEREQKLEVTPEPLVLKSNISECESDSSRGLRIHLNKWETTSNSSSAMTPRIEKANMHKHSEEEVKINKEIDFTSKFREKSRLSPDQISRVIELTNQRKKEYAEEREIFTSKTIKTPEYYEPCILDEDKEERQKQIIERLENLL